MDSVDLNSMRLSARIRVSHLYLTDGERGSSLATHFQNNSYSLEKHTHDLFYLNLETPVLRASNFV
jgi:hypothetical protein